MKAIIVLFGSLCLCFAAPVEEHHDREGRSASKEEGLRTLLTEVRETLANVNRNTNMEQPAVAVPHEEQSQLLPGIPPQALPAAAAEHSPDVNPAPGPAHINLVISTQPQQPQAGNLPPQHTPADPNTVLIPPCAQTAAQQPSAQVSPCYVTYSGPHQPGLSHFLPYTSPAIGPHLNGFTYPGILHNHGVSPINPLVNLYAGHTHGVSSTSPVSPINPLINPYAGYNYGVSPINPHMHPFAGLMSPHIGMTPPIIFRQTQTPSGSQAQM